LKRHWRINLLVRSKLANREDIGLFGPEVRVVGNGKSNAGRPRLPIRLMVSLPYLKHAFNESDEGVVKRWAKTPTWQYFSGMDYFEQACHATPL